MYRRSVRLLPLTIPFYFKSQLLMRGTSLSHVSQLLEVPGCFFHNSDNNNSFVKLQFSPFGTYASVGLENWGKQ